MSENTDLEALDDLLAPLPDAGQLFKGGISRGAARYLDKRAWWRVPTNHKKQDGLEIPVVIRDVRSHFGMLDFLIEPEHVRDGTRRWVQAESLTVIQEG